MTIFTSIPKKLEEVLEARAPLRSRRDFLKTSGLIVVSVGAAAAGAAAGGGWCSSMWQPPDSDLVDGRQQSATPVGSPS